MAKNIDSRKTNFIRYCQALNVFGKNILVKLLKWFYEGGDASYLDYLKSVYSVRGTEDLINASQRSDLMNKTPDEFDMGLLHILLQLTCNLYDVRTQDSIGDIQVEIFERGVESLVLQCMSATDLKPSLTDSELEEKLYELRKLYEDLIKKGGKLSGVDRKEIQEFYEETAYGVMSLNTYIEKYNPAFTEEKKKLLRPDLLNKLTLEAERLSTKSKVKKKDTGFYKDFLEQRFLGRARQWKSRTKSGFEPAYEKQTQVVQEKEELSQCSRKNVKLGKSAVAEKSISSENSMLGDKVSSSCDREIQPAVSQTKDVNNIYSIQNVVDTGVRNIKAHEMSSSDNLTPREEKQRIIDLQTKIVSLAASNTYKKGHLPQAQGVSPSLLYTDTDILLKQHGKYSRRPSQQVKLQDMFNVEGMNDKVAEIFIVSGEGGMGKTMLLNYILEMWSTSQNVIENLESRDLLFFHELKNDSCSTFTDLVLNTLKSKVENLEEDSNILKTVVLDMPILVILDGYDESCEKSCQLVKEVVQMSGSNLRIIISSRPQYVDSIYRQIPKQRKKHVSHLSLNGIPSTHRADIVSRLIDSRLTGRRNKFHIERIKTGLINRLPELYDAIGEDLCNPLMITIITEMWLENPLIESNDSIKHII